MYHIIGLRFQSIDDVRKKIRSLQNRWATAVAPAIVRFAVESGRHQPESDDMNGRACIIILYNNYYSCYSCYSVLFGIIGRQTQAKRKSFGR